MIFAAVSKAGKLLQRVLSLDREAVQFPNHEVHHIVGVTFGVNAIEIPRPLRGTVIEGE